MKNFVKFLLLLFTFLVCSPVFAENFYIENYVVNLNVNKDKSVQIVEDIDANFTTPSHGIIREIPHPNATIDNIDVSSNYSVAKEGKRVKIKIGDADKLVSGPVHYTIKYDYNYEDNKNEFYHNIIGTQWAVPIKKVKFHLELPDKINPQAAGISIGKYGTKGFDGGAKYTITDDRIVDFETTTRSLGPNEGVTFRVPVSEGYFEEYFNPMKGLTKFMMFVYLLIAFVLWFIFGKDKHVTPVVSFELPKDINAMDAELIYKEKVTKNGLVALLVELASKDYLKIDEDKNGFKLTKKKNFSNNGVEKDYLNAIFGNKEIVTEEKLKTSSTYYCKCENIIDDYNENNKANFFSKASISHCVFRLSMFCIVGIIFCMLATLCNFHIAHMLFPEGVFSDILKLLADEDTSGAIIIFGASWCLLGSVFFTKFDMFTAQWLGWSTGILWFVLWCYDYTNCTDPACFWTGVLFLVIAIICTINLPSRNQKGQEIMGQLLGLRKYIKVCQENELKLLAEQNPQHFYNVMPYAYILGVSKIWINKLNKLMKDNSGLFEDSYLLGNFVYFTNSVNKYSGPTYDNGGISSSGSSSSGGGGFSGGGGGGGGGSSW